MQGDTLTIVLFLASVVISLFGWLLKQRIAAQEKENERLAEACDNNELQIAAIQREQRLMVTRTELDEYKRDTTNMIEALRTGIKIDLENIRRNEIKELHDILRDETRQTRSELREDLNNSMRAIRDELKTLHTNLAHSKVIP